jgi:hypothetical protein
MKPNGPPDVKVPRSHLILGCAIWLVALVLFFFFWRDIDLHFAWKLGLFVVWGGHFLLILGHLRACLKLAKTIPPVRPPTGLEDSEAGSEIVFDLSAYSLRLYWLGFSLMFGNIFAASCLIFGEGEPFTKNNHNLPWIILFGWFNLAVDTAIKLVEVLLRRMVIITGLCDRLESSEQPVQKSETSRAIILKSEEVAEPGATADRPRD